MMPVNFHQECRVTPCVNALLKGFCYFADLSLELLGGV